MRFLPACRHVHTGDLFSVPVFCIAEMTYRMKKEHAFWATVCLLLSAVPEPLNALPEEADGTGKILQGRVFF